MLRYPKSTYMYWQRRLNKDNPDKEIESKISSIVQKNHGNYGYRRVGLELRKQGIIVNHKKVLRITRKLGLTCSKFTRKSRRFSTYKGTIGKVAANLIRRRFSTNIPHQKITTDTSEFKYIIQNPNGQQEIKKAYLDPFLDMYNGEIISFSISEKPGALAIATALREAIDRTSDCPYRRTFHSDQGWIYQRPLYTGTLKKHSIFQSMSRKGNCLDNSPMENFFGIMKQEMFYDTQFHSFQELSTAITDYIFYYNNTRIKERLGGLSPIEFRQKNYRKIV